MNDRQQYDTPTGNAGTTDTTGNDAETARPADHGPVRDLITRRWPRNVGRETDLLVDWIDEKGSIIRLITSSGTRRVRD